MNPREQGFLLLTSALGSPHRRPLTPAQFRELTARVHAMERPPQNRRMTVADLTAIGYGEETACRILTLLQDREALEYYIHKGAKRGCVPITRVSEGYPLRVRKALGEDSPGCLWAMGDTRLLEKPCVSLVGSRDLKEENRRFAEEAGRQAALQGYVLVSGNARGADQAAQRGCLSAGGSVISIVADTLEEHSPQERVLYLSEDSFDLPFSAQRAHSRNRVIHAISPLVLVAQSSKGVGGTWKGTVNNLRHGWSRVCCFRDESPASLSLVASGGVPITINDLADLPALENTPNNLFDP